MLRNYRRLLLVIIAVQPKLRKGRNRKKYGVFRERSKGERFSMIIERRENVRGTMNGIHLQILEFGHASGEQDWEEIPFLPPTRDSIISARETGS